MTEKTAAQTEEELLTARAVNAHVFCPRLYWLEYVDGVFVDNEHTIEGSHAHRRVDKPGGKIEAPDGGRDDEGDDTPPWHARSLWLSCDELGVSGQIDLVEEDGGVALPVDTKKGRAPKDGGLWPADEVQLTLQTLLLRSAGYDVHEIAAWYVASRKRVTVALTLDVERRAREAVEATRAVREGELAPAPLIDSPKCTGCSLQVVCLPDEVNALRFAEAKARPDDADDNAGDELVDGEPIRRVQPPRDTALPLYVHSPGTRVGLSKGELRLKPRRGSDDEEKKVGLGHVSQVNLFSGAQISSQALQTCLRRHIPVSFFSRSGWFYGTATGEAAQSKQVRVRLGQYRAFETDRALEVARTLVADKIANARTLLRRNRPDRDDERWGLTLDRLTVLRDRCATTEEASELLAIEGEAAKKSWTLFSELLAATDEAFAMSGRTRRPPRDRTNALLSFGYAVLVKDCRLACRFAGLDPYLGMYHRPHHGNPALALDLMEPFRPLIVDSVVLGLVRRQEVAAKDFVLTGQAVAMKKRARTKLLRGYERRMDELVTHPVFGYQISYRSVLSVQARLLARYLTGELDAPPSFRTR